MAVGLALFVGVILPTISFARPAAPAVIDGYKFTDLNDSDSLDLKLDANGNKIPDEPVLSGQTIHIMDAAYNSFQVQTDENGYFKFESSTGGDFKIWSRIPSGWLQTTPIKTTALMKHSVSVSNGERQTVNFGIRDLSVPVKPPETPNSVPQITLETSSNIVTTVGSTVTLNADFVDTDISDTHTVQWSFDDGSTVNAKETTYAFMSVGSHTATFTVTDNNGGKDEKTVNVAVESPTHDEKYSSTYTIAAPTVVSLPDGLSKVEIEDFRQNDAISGTPLLPVRTAKIFVAPDQELVTVEIKRSALQEIAGTYNIIHTPTPIPLSHQGPIPVTIPDETIYSTDANYPATPNYVAATPQHLHGAGIVEVEISPVVYNPVQKRLSYSSQIEVVVMTKERTTPLPLDQVPFRPLPINVEEIKDVVDNDDDIVLYSETIPLPTSDMAHQYLIITTDTLKSTFQTLADWRKSPPGGGFETHIETISNITSNYVGVDPAEKMRNFIKDSHLNHGTEYVVLGGDSDNENGQPAVPTRGCHVDMGSYTDSDIPTDLYFGNLDGTWNDDNDSTWCEPVDGVDWYSEVYVGRIAADDPTEAENQIKKIIAFETSVSPLKTLLVGEKLDSTTWGGDRLDWVSDFMGSTPKETLYDKDNTWSMDTLITEIDSNQYGWLNHLGHSGVTYNMKMGSNDITSLNNNDFMLVYSQGCYAASIDNRTASSYSSPDSFAEMLTTGDKGAFAYIGNSRYGWYNPGSYLEGASNRAHKYFAEAIFTDGHNRIGVANQKSKQNLSATSNLYRWIAFETNLLGDPATPLANPCDSPTIRSKSNGQWNASIWERKESGVWGNAIKAPGNGDTVLIQTGHTVLANAAIDIINSDWLNPKGTLCIDDGATLKGIGNMLDFTAVNIYNDGTIQGADGGHGKWTGSSYSQPSLANGVSITATTLFNNPNGVIEAGIAGQAITHGANVVINGNMVVIDEPSIDYADAGSVSGNLLKGGSVTVDAGTLINKGTIGPKAPNEYSGAQLITYGGNGGIASNTHKVNSDCENDSSVDSAYNLGTGYNSGPAWGGDGGDTTITAMNYLMNDDTGAIGSGYGGDARVWNYCHNDGLPAVKGAGGNLTVTLESYATDHSTLVLRGILNGGTVLNSAALGSINQNAGGKVLAEPEIMVFGPNMRIKDAMEIKLFGGENWKLELRDLSPNALVAVKDITLAVGPGGVIDLRGNTAKIMKAGGKIKFFSDNILLDEDVQIEDLVEASSVETHPSKILHEVTVSGPDVLTREPGITARFDVKVLNVGPTVDTYTLNVSDSKGWQLSTLPSTITVEGLKTAKLGLDITLPATPGTKDVVTVTATSQADPTISAKTEIVVMTEGEALPIQFSVSGKVLDKQGEPLADTTIQVGDKVITTDETGHWSIVGITEGEYTVNASKEGYTFEPAQVNLTGDETSWQVTLVVLSEPVSYRAFGILKDKEGNPLPGVTIQIGDKTTTTDTTGSWEINGLAEGEYTVIASKAGYQFDSKPCVVSDNEKVCQPALPGESVLDIKVVPEPRIAKQGENVTYSITVTNQGEETASSVTLADVLPDNTDLVTIESLEGGRCESETITCNLPDLTPGATANVKVVISNRQAKTLINTVTVTTQEYPTDVKKTWTRVIPYLSVSVTDQPDPIEMLNVLHYSVAVELSHYAP
ncbi:MAG: C25 family cysteine peptidase, partial [Candidatus Parabeggiatoa sp.]|nr:C25 family cysteine peptidase [Candidatus Parabeggiatoa sp.]